MAPHFAAATTVMGPVDAILQIFNTNPYFIGLMMLILNLGGRFIGMEVTKQQEQFLQHPWVRRGLIFTVLFVATRNLWVAFWMTIAVVLLLGYLFNENSALCLFGDGGKSGSKCSKEKEAAKSSGDVQIDLTPEEKEILQRLMQKQQRYQQGTGDSNKSKTNTNERDDDDVSYDEVYTANMFLLKK